MHKTISSNSSKSKGDLGHPLPFVREGKEGIYIHLSIQPRASKNELRGIHGSALKMRLTSPPVEGAANVACIDFLAHILGIKKSRIEITTGQKSRFKQVKVNGISLKELEGKLLKSLAAHNTK